MEHFDCAKTAGSDILIRQNSESGKVHGVGWASTHKHPIVFIGERTSTFIAVAEKSPLTLCA